MPNNHTIRINGVLFKCNCGCNVFKKIAENEYQCNLCENEYKTEDNSPLGRVERGI